jgi:hypothetical protein
MLDKLLRAIAAEPDDKLVPPAGTELARAL